MKRIASIALSFAFLANIQAQEIDLKLNLKVGESYPMHTETNSTASQTMMGQSIDINTTTIHEASYTVKSKNGDIYEMTGRNSKISTAASSNNPMVPVQELSSEGDQSLQDNQVLNALTKHNMDFSMNEQGQFIASHIDENFWDNALKEIYTDQEEYEDAIVKYSAMGGPDMIKNNLSAAFTYIPDGKVKTGDKWTRSISSDENNPMNIVTEYELTEVTDAYVIIQSNAKIATPEEGTKIEQQGMEMLQKMSGTQSATYKIDRKTGWIIEGTTNQSVEGKTVVEDGAQLPKGFEIPMSINTKIEYNK